MSFIPELISAYFQILPDAQDPQQRVAFGTSGHRGCSRTGSFNEAHIRAIAQAVAEYRKNASVTGPLFLVADTHALSMPALGTALSVLVANEVDVRLDSAQRPVATPLVSRAILSHNAEATVQADALILTPSHNPPEDGGIKYNGPDGGPASSDTTGWIERRANELLADGGDLIPTVALDHARERAGHYDFVTHYVAALSEVVDMEAIAGSGLRLGVDPMGGATLSVWEAIREHYGLAITLTQPRVAPDFAFLDADHDGRIRMDCSSEHAMASAIAKRHDFDLVVANDADGDRHGIVDAGGLLNSNHFLSVCIDYLLTHRPGWPASVGVGKTAVSSAMIDRVVAHHGRALEECPVGFKWFVQGLRAGRIGFAGEESAGASFLDRQGRPWSTDKDGLIPALLAAEIQAVTGETPGACYRRLTHRFGEPHYRRVDQPATAEAKAAIKALGRGDVEGRQFAGETVTHAFSQAPGNEAPLGGIKVVLPSGWLALRPSGTEALCKLYAESFRDETHLEALVGDGQRLLSQLVGE